MEMTWNTPNSKWHGRAEGEGNHLLLCLHGYGNQLDLFRGFLNDPPPGYRVVSLDLPLFGKSILNQNTSKIEPLDLETLLQSIQASFPDLERISLLGFSLGSKVILSMVPVIPLPLEQVVLVSPDGLRIHPLYRFCIYNPLGRGLFKAVLRWPSGFLFVLRMLYHLKIADAFKYQFVKRQFEQPEQRKLLERVWLGYAALRPKINALATHSTTTATNWHLIWGKKDTILPVSLSERFMQEVPGAKLHLVDGGHRLLNKPGNSVEQLIRSLLSPQ